MDNNKNFLNRKYEGKTCNKAKINKEEQKQTLLTTAQQKKHFPVSNHCRVTTRHFTKNHYWRGVKSYKR